VKPWQDDRVGTAERGENPTTLMRMRSGYAFVGDYQFLPGYCVLTAVPEVDHLSDLPFKERGQFLLDMSVLGEAIMAVCKPRRINYEVLGNTLPILHAHVWARYEWEPEDYRGGPAWLYPQDHRYNDEYVYSEERYGQLKAQLAVVLHNLMVTRNINP